MPQAGEVGAGGAFPRMSETRSQTLGSDSESQEDFSEQEDPSLEGWLVADSTHSDSESSQSSE